MNDPFARPRPDGCLSAFRVSRAALDELSPAERATVDAHLATCPRCAARIADERASVAAATLEPIPAALRATSGRRRPSWQRWLAPLVAMAAAAVVAFVALPAGGPQNRLKGGLNVEATVVRDGQTVLADTGLGDLGALTDGDRMRLRVRAGAGREIRVEGLDGGDWVRVWEGAVPRDGWLPFGLTASAGSETALRVAICAPDGLIPDDVFRAAATPDGCLLRTWILDVR